MEKTLVVTPTYNEAENIEKFITQVLAQDPSVEMLIVDDNSPDGTGAILDELTEEHKGQIHVIHNEGKNGDELRVFHFSFLSMKIFNNEYLDNNNNFSSN